MKYKPPIADAKVEDYLSFLWKQTNLSSKLMAAS